MQHNRNETEHFFNGLSIENSENMKKNILCVIIKSPHKDLEY